MRTADSTDAISRGVLRVGPDEVSVVDNAIAIDARHRMPDWEVRDFEQVPVFFQDEKWLLVQVRKAPPPFAVRYILRRWPAEHLSSAKNFWSYDEETVAHREAHLRRRTFEEVVRALLMPVYPVLGLLWSGMQHRLTRFGFIPRSLTHASLYMMFLFVYVQGIFLLITLFAASRGGVGQIGGFFGTMVSRVLRIGPVTLPMGWFDFLLAVICAADCLVRLSHYMREDQWSGGFLEWLRPARRT
jgi:hypothetical protein